MNKKLICFFIFLFSISLFAQQTDTGEYVRKGWALVGEGKFDEVYKVVDECIKKFEQQAEKLALRLNAFPPKGEENEYQIMNDVATCYFIKGEALRDQGEVDQAKGVFGKVIEKYPYAQAFDPRGWFWSIREKAEITINKIETGVVDEGDEEEDVIISSVLLNDPGIEFPVQYRKYGTFEGLGTKDYKYMIKDPISLAKAVGEGIYPNSHSVKFDPEFIKIKKRLASLDHWKILNSRDLSMAFYKWNRAAEPQGVRQFYLAEILERSGLLEHAIKAYYAVVVSFPASYGWTYWHTPWYVGKTAFYRIKHLLKENPQLDLVLEGASFEIINGYDNDVRNDQFVVNPGTLVRKNLSEKIKENILQKDSRKLDRVVQTQGKDFVKLVKYASGDWQLFVKGEPFMLQGITYTPTKVGESPDKGTLQDWTFQDTNGNGKVDGPYDSWVDTNGNEIRDPDEKIVGDFQLMKEMGVNVIRLYQQPHTLDKEVLKQLCENYGIYVAIGDFFGKYAIGSGATWEEGTDYDNPQHIKNMLASVKKMVDNFKDEPFVIMWLIGNENIYGLGCNADKKPESFFKAANEAAKLIKSLDPKKRPVAIASGDTLFLDVFAKNCPDIDIFGTNAYRGKYGFLGLWDSVKNVSGKPAMITEYGAPAYAKGYSLLEAEEFQAVYHQAAWQDMLNNSCGVGAGNALGGFIFQWMDEWWKAYEPFYHDRKGLFAGPFLDGFMHEEWLGLCGQGNGGHSPFLRQLRKAYFIYKKIWDKKKQEDNISIFQYFNGQRSKDKN